MFIKVIWFHQNVEDPILIYSELNPSKFEIRKVELFRNGKIGIANAALELNSMLGICEVPSLAEINMNREFFGFEINKDEFECVWNEALQKVKMSIRGIRFQTGQDDNIRTASIFAALDAYKYRWYIENLDALDREFDSEFNVKFTDGEKMVKKLRHHNVNAVFGEFIAFDMDDVSISDKPEINDWDAFVKSRAKIVVLIVDCYYIDVYLKDLEVLERFSRFISSQGFAPELIDERDARYKFKVW